MRWSRTAARHEGSRVNERYAAVVDASSIDLQQHVVAGLGTETALVSRLAVQRLRTDFRGPNPRGVVIAAGFRIHLKVYDDDWISPEASAQEHDV